MSAAIFTLVGLALIFGVAGIFPAVKSGRGGEEGAKIYTAVFLWMVGFMCFLVAFCLLLVKAMS